MIRDIGLALFSLTVVWAIGFVLIRRLRLFRGHASLFIWGASLGIGGGVLSLLLLITATLTGRLSLVPGYLLLVAVAASGARMIFGERPAAPPAPPERRMAIWEIALLMVLGTIVLAMVASGSVGTLVGDGWAIWGFKARAFFLRRGVDPALLRDEMRYGFAHLDYPLLLPLMEWWIYRHVGHVNESVVRLVHVGFYLSLLTAFYGSLRAYVGRAAAILCTVILALLGPAVLNALDGYADLIQGYYAFLGFISFIEWLNGGQRGGLASAGVSLSLGAHVKAEGVSWLAAIIVSVVLARWLTRAESPAPFRTLWPSLAIAVPVAGIWPLYRWAFDIPFSPVIRWPTPDLVASRLPLLLEAFGAEFGARGVWQQGWGLLWVVTFLGCLRALVSRSGSRRRILCCWSPLLIQGLLVSVVYLLTVAPLKWQLETSFTRVLLQCAPSCLWAAAATLIPGEPFSSIRRDGDPAGR